MRGLPLAGYPRLNPFWDPEMDPGHRASLFHPNHGFRDEIRAKALALRVAGRTVVWVSADLLVIPETLLARVHRLLVAQRLSVDLLIVSASHTHLGYVTTLEEYRKGGYEAMATLFGPRTSISLLEACRELFGLMRAKGSAGVR